MSYLRYLYLFVYCGVQHILCCVFALSLEKWNVDWLTAAFNVRSERSIIFID
jgi:hypothetical protein